MSKYYAVVKGKTPGIYRTWKETQSMVSGYPGAIFKSFSTEADAQNFINCSIITSDTIIHTKSLLDKHIIYTDGSYRDNLCGFGCVIIAPNADKYEAFGSVPSTIKEKSNNVAELYAIYVALSLIKDDVILYTDSQYAVSCLTTYIHDWVKIGWKNVANRDLIEAIYNKTKDRKIHFQHVSAHCGITYNEEADLLAAKGVYREENLIIVKNGLQIVL